MHRKNFMVLLLSLVFIVAMSACAKKQATETATDPEVMEDTSDPMTEVTESDMSDRDVEAEPMEAIPVLEDVFFAFDKADLSSEAKRKLENNARQLKDAKSVSITIEGHCDERGTSAYTLALGERRAKAAAGFLRSLGVSTSRVKTVSYGEEKPFASGSNEAAWAKNRRAHFVIAKK
jgi:peptidoglycan-associated lipoprotein